MSGHDDGTRPLDRTLEGDGVYVRNEFAMVRVRVVREDEERAGLELTDMDSGDRIVLDALELESLTHLSHETFSAIVPRPG